MIGQTDLDGEHDVSLAFQHLHCIAVGDVLKAHAVGRQNLIAHLDAMLLCQTTWVQPSAE